MAFDKNLVVAVAEEFEAKRQAREELIRARRAELYQKIPSLPALEDEIASVSFKTFLKVADGFDAGKAALSIKEEVERLTGKRDILIKEAGYTADYLSPSFGCPFPPRSHLSVTSPPLSAAVSFFVQPVAKAAITSTIASIIASILFFIKNSSC